MDYYHWFNGSFNYTFLMDNPRDALPERTRFAKLLYEIIVPVVFGLITLTGAVGNSLVIFVIIGKKKMRSATNILLLNLAIADLIFVLICPPFKAYHHATDEWPFGNVPCKLMHYLVNVSIYVTIYTLVLICVIRYLTIVHSQKTTRIRSSRNIVCMMGTIWIIMLVVNIQNFWIYSERYVLEGYKDYSIIECAIISEEAGKNSSITLFVFAYIVPLVVIGAFSVRILRYILKQRPSFMSREHRTQGNNKKRQASRILIIVLLLFALLWLPLHIILLLVYSHSVDDYLDTNEFELVYMICSILAYSNSCVNPLVYNFASKDFRDSFGDVVMCRRSSMDRILGNNLVTRTTTAQCSPDTRHRRQKRSDTEAEVIPLTNGHAQSQVDITNGYTMDTEIEVGDSVQLDML